MRRTISGFLLGALIGAGLAAAVERPHHLDDAIRAQQRLADARPNDSGVLNDLGNLLALAGRTERAEDAYQRALQMAPDDPTVHYNLGLLLRQTGRERAALQALERVVEIDPTYAWAHYQLAALLEQRRKREKAIHHFAQAFLLDPTLTELEINPQLLDSKLLSHALTIAYVERTARLEGAPRQYEQPKRITRLLVPEVRRGSKAVGEQPAEADAEAGAPGRRQKKKKKSQPSGDS